MYIITGLKRYWPVGSTYAVLLINADYNWTKITYTRRCANGPKQDMTTTTNGVDERHTDRRIRNRYTHTNVYSDINTFGFTVIRNGVDCFRVVQYVVHTCLRDTDVTKTVVYVVVWPFGSRYLVLSTKVFPKRYRIRYGCLQIFCDAKNVHNDAGLSARVGTRVFDGIVLYGLDKDGQRTSQTSLRNASENNDQSTFR